MTYKEKLIEFMKIKNSYTSSRTLYYMDKKDFNEIKSWSEKLCQKIYKAIVNYIYDNYNTHTFNINTRTCPWCIIDSFFKYNSLYDCFKCGYGKRHGICNEYNSLYYKLSKLNKFSILTIHKYKEIINNIEK